MQYNFIDDLGSLLTEHGFSLREDYLTALTLPAKIIFLQSVYLANGDDVIRSQQIDKIQGKGK